MTRRSILSFTFAVFMSVAIASQAIAANCSSPTGSEGQVRYDSTAKALYVCDGTNWKLASRKLCCGNTKTDGTGWTDSPGTVNFAVINVNTSGCGFTSTPYYFTNLIGITHHATAVGQNAIYSPTATGFTIYVSRYNTNDASAALADSKDWYVNWCGVVDSSINAAGSTGTLY